MKIKRIVTLCCVGLLFAGMVSAQTESDWKAGVSQVKEMIKSNPEGAWDLTEDLMKGKNKKNVDLILALAQVYLDADKTEEIDELLAKAKKADKKDPRIFLMEGDIALAKKDVGLACSSYEQAILFDPNCYEAYLKYARAYKSASPSMAIQKLTDLKNLAGVPQDILLQADKAMAEVHYSNNKFADAAKAYENFIHTDVATESDILSYAFALFMSHDFEASYEIASKGLQKNAESTGFNRLAMYNLIDLKRYDEAKAIADVFFNQLKDVNYSGLDYRYYGALLNATQDYAGAITQFEKAYELDTTAVELLQQISEAYNNNGNYDKGIETYKRYCDALPAEEKTAENIFTLAGMYYDQGTDTVNVALEQRQIALQEADTLYAQVCELAPDSYTGYFYRGHTRSAMDPETTQGLAKPYYEKVVELVLAKNDPRYNRVLITCYSYLGYYFMLQAKPEDYAISKEYWNKILTIDPNNALAKTALKGIEDMGQ
ncbi:MAG TPA: hypothetical protein H9814_02900 [Candidatus Bacteroides merdigallinarum]|uniref:Tetratricopeptide repeat protein n=1 Tax=Candidatus Bacteroides merdigallinarum TaxID=2838473 RepID=A0A9D2E822_9BACE|nr:hypothetical protein [Candidatus Bacteroides merdigallinarum]